MKSCLPRLRLAPVTLSLALASAAAVIVPGAVAIAEELTIVGFNVESGDADPAVIAERHIAPLDGADLWGFSEVQNASWLSILKQGAAVGENAEFQSVLGTTGGADRLAIVYNSDLLELVSHEELSQLSYGGRARAALVAQFRLRQSGDEFLFMVNHLYRSRADLRHEQAGWLNAWAQQQTLPIVAVGDYNFDYHVVRGDAGDRDQGFDLLTAGHIFSWVRPQILSPTICNARYYSVLDFVFVANQAQTWPVTSSDILFTDAATAYCPDTPTTSDHRPVLATFQTEVPVPQPLPPSRDEEIQRLIQEIEQRLDEIQRLLDGPPTQGSATTPAG